MTQNQTSSQPLLTARPILVGAAIGLVLISLFLISAGEPNPEWSPAWRIKPLLMMPFAGAMGGVFWCFMRYLSAQNRINSTVAILLSLVVFVVGLWMGFVLGLNGTYWN